MELVAILAHKYIMHGPGWCLHKSHHANQHNYFELNDLYFIIFSIPSIFSIVYGLISDNNILLSIGIGILIYGIVYLLLHDAVVHQRFGKIFAFQNSYLKKIKKSHLLHHSVKNKKGSKKFGFITY